MNSILETKSLSAGYGKKIIVNDVNLDIEPGKIMTLIGPNGSGKTTILKTILRQLEPVSGCIYLNGEMLNKLDGNTIARNISMVTTKRPKTEVMSCREVVSTGRYPYTGRLGILSKEDALIVDDAISFMQIEDISECDFNTISDGQKQRVMLARAICQQPRVLVLDEPTSYLDIRYKLDILKKIRILAREKNVAIIMSLHELDLAKKISDIIVCVEDNHVGMIGTAEDVFSKGYIPKLYGIDENSFDEKNGMLIIEDLD